MGMPSALDQNVEGGGSPPRLGAVEGFRAYLALWVVICHALWASGYEPAMLSGLPSLLRQGDLAVEVFVIISAFVIFLLLDTKRLSFVPFIVRRFFRLFPLFVVLFIIAIPISKVSLWNATHAGAYLTPQHIDHQVLRIESWWQNLEWHAPLHLLMLQGAVPETLLSDSPGAFLDPAWSVSLEWQFYLVAPLAFGLAVSSRPFRRIALYLGCGLLFLAARGVLPPVKYGAALPYHVEYFFVGAVSYFIYRSYSGRARAANPFLLGCCVALVLVGAGGDEPLRFVPLALWIAFLGLMLEDRSTISWRIVSSLFTNRIAQGLGRISYSIYLSHMLLLAIVQYALLRWAPDLGRAAHFGVLLALTAVGTILASMFLYQYLEAPGISVGRALTQRLEGIHAPGRGPRTTAPRARPAVNRLFTARRADTSRSA
jgi:peptidoglycan/LPS O-acetylase OafA/YrhL